MTKKEKLICTVTCPWCNERLVVIKETEVLIPATPAEKQEKFKTVKDTQLTLEAAEE